MERRYIREEAESGQDQDQQAALRNLSSFTLIIFTCELFCYRFSACSHRFGGQFARVFPGSPSQAHHPE